ncbi:MAG: hypothetical protein NTX53_10890 [candidate division WOR-3 bacterium]|nr:hypothetical protein [candidate division WOR-3 bacterium]
MNSLKKTVFAIVVGTAVASSAQAVGLSILDIQEVKVLKQAFVGELEKSQASIESERKDACESGNTSKCQDMLQRERVGKEIIRVTKAVMGLDENLPPPPLSPTGLVKVLVGPSEQPKRENF